MNILIVDDNTDSTMLIKELIKNDNEKVNTNCVDNSSDALKIIKNLKYDLYLLDYDIDDFLNGYELAKKIKRVNSNAKIFIITGMEASCIKSEHNDWDSFVDGIIVKGTPINKWKIDFKKE